MKHSQVLNAECIFFSGFIETPWVQLGYEDDKKENNIKSFNIMLLTPNFLPSNGHKINKRQETLKTSKHCRYGRFARSFWYRQKLLLKTFEFDRPYW